MKKISDYLDAYRAAKGLPSDYALAHDLDLTKQAVSKYRNNKGGFDLDVAWRIADAIGVDVSEILAVGEIERARRTHNEAREKIWIERLQHVSAAMMLFLVMFFPASSITADPLPSAAGADKSSSVYYVKYRHQACLCPLCTL